MAHLTMVLFRDGHGDSGDAVAALLRDVARSGAGRYSVTEVDVQARPGLAAHYHVRTTPTILLMKHGDIVDRVVGTPTRGLLDILLDGRTKQAPATSLDRGPRACRVWLEANVPVAS
jgi:thioredoxin-like negative regulator of GroEL